MGTQFHLEGSPASSLKKLDRFFRPRPPITMKMFLVLALVAAVCAEPEADPQLLLHTPYVKPVVPVVDATHYTAGVQKFSNGAVVPEDTMSVKLAKAQHFQAKAVEYMKKPYMVAPVVYKAPIAPVAPLAHHTYAPYTYPYAAHHFVKREAEAEPEADAQVLLNTYKAGVLPYTAGVLPYAHHTYARSYIKPAVTYKAPVVYKAPLTTSYMAPYTYPYAGVHRVFKREAEAEPEADSQVLLNNYAYSAGVLPTTYTAGVYPYTTAGVLPSTVYNAGVVPKVYSGVYPTTSYTYPYVY